LTISRDTPRPIKRDSSGLLLIQILLAPVAKTPLERYVTLVTLVTLKLK